MEKIQIFEVVITSTPRIDPAISGAGLYWKIPCHVFPVFTLTCDMCALRTSTIGYASTHRRRNKIDSKSI
jgi:hypothetical protein